METIASQKGGHLILYEGYRYRRARENSDGSVSWLCVRVPCKGRIKIVDENEVSIITEHGHAPNPEENDAAKSIFNMRRRATTTAEAPRRIVHDITSQLSLAASVQMPTHRALRRTIQRARKRSQQPYGTLSTVADIRIPDALMTTTRNMDFLLWDSGDDDEDRILMFGTATNLSLLHQHQNWHVDGTFKVAPELFFQLFTVHALIDNRTTLPMVYVLLQDKTEVTYTRVFRKLLELRPDLNPRSCVCDFEKAVHNSLSQVFDGVALHGCLFHLGQNLWRKVQELHLAGEYRDDPDFRANVKMVLALSFVPVQDVVSAFEELIDSSPATMDPLLSYWEDTYIGHQMRRNRRMDPKFPIVMWNVHDSLESPTQNKQLSGRMAPRIPEGLGLSSSVRI
ncbi:uncharacterized protein LOC116174627 [Photinus pyralis]|uniref:uncharacterized protein LOC116174627 n=1 Tax=Photinus pyralis TaxID=7054 RepID=UPI001267065C|nr:uncharacterized protein LOC116174627 [Photinus pyralis]